MAARFTMNEMTESGDCVQSNSVVYIKGNKTMQDLIYSCFHTVCVKSLNQVKHVTMSCAAVFVEKKNF